MGTDRVMHLKTAETMRTAMNQEVNHEQGVVLGNKLTHTCGTLRIGESSDQPVTWVFSFDTKQKQKHMGVSCSQVLVGDVDLLAVTLLRHDM
jgi:hypothetical protein